MSVSGDVVEVRVRSRGSQLVGAHAAAATSITVADPTDFDTAGGLLLFDGQVYTWTSVTVNGTDDEATATLAITPALVADEPDTMPVELWSGAQVIDDVILTVDAGGDTPASVRLLSYQRKDWTALEGYVEPPVPATFTDDFSELLDVDGYTPAVDLSDAAGTLPAPILAQIPTGPTVAPTAVPTPTVYADSGVAVVTWSAPTEAFTRLRLYVTNTLSGGGVDSAALKDGSTLYASDVKPGVFVSSLTPGGTALDPSKVYQFALGAFNEIGAGPFSAWVLGTAAQIHPLLIADAAIINVLTTNELTTIKLSGGTINIAQTASGTEDQQFTGTTLPAGWTSNTATQGTVSVTNAGVPSGTTGSALLIANNGAVAGSFGLWARSGITSGDSTLEARFQLGGDPFRTSPAGASEPYPQIGIRSGADPSSSAGIYMQIETSTATPEVRRWRVLGSGVSFPSQTFSWVINTWYRMKLQVIGGVVGAKVWADGGTEPDWIYGTTTVSLSSGATYARLTSSGTTNNSRNFWLDYVKTTSYATGFQVLPDGTGDWPAALDPIRAVNTTQDGRLTAVEGRATTLEGYSAGTRLTSLESGQTTQNGRLTALESKVGTYLEFVGNNSYSPTSTTNVATDLTLSFTATGTSDKWLVGLVADAAITTAGSVNVAEVLVDGTTALFSVSTSGPATTRATGFKQGLVTGLSAGSHTLTVRTRNTAAATGSTLRTGQSLLCVERKA